MRSTRLWWLGLALSLPVLACSSSSSGNAPIDDGQGASGAGQAGSSAEGGSSGNQAGSGGEAGAAGEGGETGGAGGASGGAGGASGSEPLSLNGCSAASYLDLSNGDASDRTLTWDLTIVDSPKRCSKIKAGQILRFEGSFSAHPLGPQGGDEPNPFDGLSPLDQGTDTEHESVTFAAPGTFGYTCAEHPSMTGAVWVVP